MSTPGAENPVRYEDLLRVIGAYIDARGLREAVVLQLPDGIQVKGLTAQRHAAGKALEVEIVTFTNVEIREMLLEYFRQRNTQAPTTADAPSRPRLRLLSADSEASGES
jgi:hypothetical protein